jgi:hypothetical protein
MATRPSFGHSSGQRGAGRPRSRARRSISAIPAARASVRAHDERPTARKMPPSSTGTQVAPWILSAVSQA